MSELLFPVQPSDIPEHVRRALNYRGGLYTERLPETDDFSGLWRFDGAGVTSWVGQIDKNMIDATHERTIQLVDVGDDGIVGYGEVTLLETSDEYYCDKPMVMDTFTREEHRSCGLGSRRIAILGGATLACFELPLHSGDKILDPAALAVWEKLANDGYAKRLIEPAATRGLEFNRFRMTPNPDKLENLMASVVDFRRSPS